MLVDVHVHAYPTHVAERISKISSEMGVEAGVTADADGYLSLLEEGLIDIALLNEHVANQRLVPKANDFVSELTLRMPGRVYGMAVVGRPDETSPDEFRRCVQDLGFVGLKFQGAVVQTAPTDSYAMRIWETALELQVPVLAHGGPHQEEMYRHLSPNSLFEREHAAPSEWLPVVREFPDLKLVLAHLGGAAWYKDDLMRLLEQGPNVLLDTSLWTLGLSADGLTELINEVGPERIVFGSDYPGSDARRDVADFERLSLSAEAREMIGWKNAVRFFGLDYEGSDR